MSEGASGSNAARERTTARMVCEVADYLDNTPAVARASYIDPRASLNPTKTVTRSPRSGVTWVKLRFGDLATRGRSESPVLKPDDHDTGTADAGSHAEEADCDQPPA